MCRNLPCQRGVFRKNSAVAAAVYVEIQGMDRSPS